MKTSLLGKIGGAVLGASLIWGCSAAAKDKPKSEEMVPGMDDTAGGDDAKPAMGDDGKVQVASIDRFSDAAGHLMRRSASPALPGPNEAIDFDQGPFITQGFGPSGEAISYYNFDVQSTTPAPIYVFFKEGADAPVEGQANVVEVIPGDEGYSDFWNVVKVTVPDNYVANSIKSVADLLKAGYPTATTSIIVNCPIVPAGSVATRRYGQAADNGLHEGWYQGELVTYFNFSEKALSLTSSGQVPVSPIFVTFNKNPNPADPTSGPASGFRLDPETGRTHNVTQTTPEDADYSPLWNVTVYDNEFFFSVDDLASAAAAAVLARGVANVNCPIVESAPGEEPMPSPTDGSSGVVQLVQTTAGEVLADAEGLSLYTFDQDTSATSTCYNACALAWPPLVTNSDSIAAPYLLTPRMDGSKQLSYNGRPLYRYVGDGATGEINGEGLGGVWHLAKP